MKKEYFISVEIGGTNLRYAIIDNRLNIIYFNKIKTRELSESKNKTEYLSKNIIDFLMKDYKIKALTFAIASLMDKERTTLFSSPMIKGFENIDLKKSLEDAYNIKVVLERDVNALLLYDIKKNNLLGKGIVAGVYLGTGLGNAIAIDGKIYIGQNGAASELGHIPVLGFNKKCGCGKTGCIELLTSGKTLSRIAKKLKCDSIENIFRDHKNSRDIKNFIRCFALAVAAEISILDPIAVIVGGGVVLMKDFPKKYFEDEVRKNLRTPSPRKDMNILYSGGEDHAGVVGATINAKNMLS